MAMDTNTPHQEIDWLKRPKFAGRANWASYLFMPYSVKMQSNLYLYTPKQYSHWVDVEWEVNIIAFNEHPPAISIPINGRVEQIQFDMACRGLNGRVFLRRLSSCEIESQEAALEKAIDAWTEAASVEIERLNIESFLQPSVLRENKREFLHFISAARNDIVRPSTEEILDFVGRNPRVTISHLQKRFDDFDPTTIVAVLGELLMAKKIAANLTTRRIDRNLALELT